MRCCAGRRSVLLPMYRKHVSVYSQRTISMKKNGDSIRGNNLCRMVSPLWPGTFRSSQSYRVGKTCLRASCLSRLRLRQPNFLARQRCRHSTRHKATPLLSPCHRLHISIDPSTVPLRTLCLHTTQNAPTPPAVSAASILEQARTEVGKHKMGGYISKFQGLIWAKKETRILILGLVSPGTSREWRMAVC